MAEGVKVVMIVIARNRKRFKNNPVDYSLLHVLKSRITAA